MKENEADAVSPNSKESQPSPGNELSDDAGCMLDLEIALSRKYPGLGRRKYGFSAVTSATA